MVLQVMQEGVPPLELPATCPEEYARLVRRCLSYNPEDRPTFTEILAELSPLLHMARIADRHLEALGSSQNVSFFSRFVRLWWN